jgi:carbon-monoxide dehydrogenase large subunit
MTEADRKRHEVTIDVNGDRSPTANTINFGTGTYRIENYEALSRVVVTNTVPVDAYRGYGRPEGGYIAERAIDAVARRLNMDQVEVRRRNFIQSTVFPHRPYGGAEQ